MCKYTFPKCCELLYRDVCLQAVMDYFDNVGVFNSTHIGICRAFHECFMAQVRLVILKKFGKYETTKLNIPKCMILGSLKDALVMNQSGKVFKYLMEQRMEDVEQTFKFEEHHKQMQKDYDELYDQGKI